MTTHWIIGIGRPKLPVISGKAMLTAVSSGTTEIPSPISTRRSQSRRAEGGATTAPFIDVALRSIEEDEVCRSDIRSHNDRGHRQYQPRKFHQPRKFRRRNPRRCRYLAA